MNPELYRLFLLAQLTNDEVPRASIEFFFNILPHLKTFYRLNSAEMGRVIGMTRESARQHARILTDAGYFTRMGYRGWKLNEPLIKNPDLIRAISKITA